MHMSQPSTGPVFCPSLIARAAKQENRALLRVWEQERNAKDAAKKADKEKEKENKFLSPQRVTGPDRSSASLATEQTTQRMAAQSRCVCVRGGGARPCACPCAAKFAT